jgi:ParB family chromosome partitioning protein
LPTKREPKTQSGETYGAGNVFECPIEKIVPQKGQPRQHFDKVGLDELAQSIREHGLIEPLVVRKQGDRYEIIAGERRWRAAQRAGLHEVLVVVRDLSTKEAFELALIENVQREDLNAIEFAEALKRLLDEHDYTQETLASRVGKDRSTISNALRLLKLPKRVRELVIAGALSEGHARALLGAPDEAILATLAEKAEKARLSVRQLEALVRAAKKDPDKPRNTKGKTAATRDLEMRLVRKLGTKCEVRDRDGRGEIAVKYSSLDELDRLLELLL